MAKKILLIDDEENIIMLLLAILEPEGYELISADNGQQGIQKASEEIPDLIISDIKMPIMGGLEMSQELQKNPATKNIPIIFLSGIYPDEQLKNSPHSHLEKHHIMDTLNQVVKEKLAENIA